MTYKEMNGLKIIHLNPRIIFLWENMTHNLSPKPNEYANIFSNVGQRDFCTDWILKLIFIFNFLFSEHILILTAIEYHSDDNNDLYGIFAKNAMQPS